ncbi:ArsR family transcriptional regulator [Streptomyces sp. WAC07149]|uniref:helix-turn-helix transcriptional regulator n=1 Tax=Streptomyces sp. WAC07149 TaxID=2487425 RepID=UPI000F788955|nr:winged helix-turn-helix domain-containing protein [Streptomyces sp. WAC07149]RST08965.1 ArsR family transcriptional regulator [Streptomyces sp. WAC07149]
MEPVVAPRTSWTFVTNHARILAMILRDPESRLRDLADGCGLTERAAGSIVRDLETAGYLTRVRRGRRNHYEITPGTLFRHPAEGYHEVANLLHLLVDLDPRAAATGPPSGAVSAMPPPAARPPSRDIGV